MLLQEEQYIIRWLSQYGTMTKGQIIKLLPEKSPQVTEKIIRGLQRQNRIYHVNGTDYYSLDPQYRADPRVIQAIWVLTRFADKVAPRDHHPGNYPCQLFFLKENYGYEVLVLEDGERVKTRMLLPEENTKYIIVLPHISMAIECQLPDAPCLFCTMSYEDGEEPMMKFYTKEAINDQT